MALSTEAPRDLVDCHRYGVTELHVPATNVNWKAGEIVGMNLSTGIAAPLATGLIALGHVPQNAGRDLTASSAGAERIIAQAGPIVVPQDGSFAADAAVGLPVYWDSTANEAVDTDNSGANAFLGDLIRVPESEEVVLVDVRMGNSLRAALDAAVQNAPLMQAVNATLVAGTVTIAAGITVAANSEVIPLLIGPITGSTNFASLEELKASRVNGAPGVGTVVIEALNNSGALDVDAAGAIRVVILTPQS